MPPLAVALGGCAFEPPACGAYVHDGVTHDGTMCEERLQRELTLSDAFTSEQQAGIVAAGDAWGVATGGRVALTWRIVGADESPDVYARDEGPTAGGRTEPRTGRISLRPWDVAGIYALHELGRHFGLGHSHPGALMASHVTCESVTPADVAHFDRVAAASEL